MSDYKNILTDANGDILFITINRPWALNALNYATLSELDTALHLAARDEAIKSIILLGAGDKAFVAGADIEELSKLGALEAEKFTRHGQGVFNFIENLGKPVIAAVNGYALGGGCELAMACSLRLGTPEAKFGQPETKLGVIPGFGGTQRLPRLVGKGRALQMILTAQVIDAEEAYRIGLLNEIIPRGQLIARATELAKLISENAPIATSLALKAVHTANDVPLAEGLALEGALFAICASTDDKQEGTAAFLAKRRPNFKSS